MRNSKHTSYTAAAVTVAYSDSMTRLSTLTNKFKAILNDKSIPQGHPDSAATSMFLANKNKYLGKELHHEGINVGVANTNTMNPATTRQLQLEPGLPMEAQKAHGFKEMDQSLIAVPVLCDADYTVVFNKGNVQVYKNNKIIIKRPRHTEINLWLMPLENNKNNNNNNNNT